MSRQKTSQRLYAEQLCKDHPNSIPTILAHTLYHSKFKKKFSNEEAARTMIRIVLGLMGKEARKKASDKSNFRPVNSKVVNPVEYTKAQKRKHNKKSQYILVTWAQNNTPVHNEFLKNIRAYQHLLNAEIHVILGRYKNPTSVFTDAGEEHWDASILPYADANRHSLHKDLMLFSDIKIQPTASNPLSGMESMSGLQSSIFGHPRVHLKVIPALEGYTPKIIMTTGACTVENYTDSKAGKKGEFHHTLGFVIVEIKDNKVFYIRQVTATKDGSFSDLNHNVTDGWVKQISGVDAVILGDKHVGEMDKPLENVQRFMLDVLKPKHTIVHDLFSGHSISHHEEKDPIKKLKRISMGQNVLQDEIDDMITWIDSMSKYNIVVVASNHDEWVDRWIASNDWKKDLVNSKTYMEISLMLMNLNSNKGAIAQIIDKHTFKHKVTTLSRLDHFTINGWELASHGDKGGNGSRGGITQFKKLSTKMVVADSHTPAREDGVLYAGTSSLLRMGFNVGASSWRHADVIIHKDKKAQHIFYMGKDKEFTTLL